MTTTNNNEPRILIVDDSEVYPKIFAKGFEGTKINPVFCKTGSEALQAMESASFCIVISALFMEDMEGVDLCRHMRKLKGYAYTPFILSTSSESTTVARNALPAGVTEIFNKSDIGELIVFIRRFLRNQTEPVHGRVLFVEDNQSQRLMVSSMLAWWGLQVDAYETADEAWMVYLEKDYDLVVTDIVLTGIMSGINLVNRIRRMDSRKGDVPILAITAFDDISRRIELFNLGVTDYVIKPVVGEELIARVRNVISMQHVPH